MWGLPPVDEERHDSVGDDAAQVGQLPRQKRAVGPPAAAGQYAAEFDAVLRGFIPKPLEPAALGSPCDKARWSAHVQPERTSAGAGQEVRIRRNNLEVTRSPQRYQRVARAPGRVLPTEGCANPEQLFDLRDAAIEVGRGIDEV